MSCMRNAKMKHQYVNIVLNIYIINSLTQHYKTHHLQLAPVNHSDGSIRRMPPLQILWKGYSQILVVKDHVGREQ